MTHFEEYMSIIQNRLVNPLPDDVYGEWHHIIPRSIDPTLAKAPSNLVRLSAQEHFMSHFHLWLYYRDELQVKEWAKSMCYAFHSMKRVITKCEDVETMAKIYSHVKEDFAKIRSEAMKGRVVSDETRKRMSEGVKEALKNPEVRAKMSEAKKKFFKKVLQYTLDGNLVSEFSSINDAQRETGCDKRSISKCCHGKRKTAGNYFWRFSADK